MAREFLYICKESALNTVKSGLVAGTDAIYIRLNDGNAFGVVTEMVQEEIMDGGGLAIPAEMISDHYTCKGSIKTKLYPSQAPLLLGWGCTRISGGTSPWTTSEPNGDLASCSVYHGIAYSDGTIRRKRYSGAKVTGVHVEVSRGSTTATLSLDIQACKSFGNAMDASSDPDGTEFPAPAETDYPLNPYTFKSTGGLLKIASAVTQYESISVAIQNAVDGRHFETSYLSVNQFCGRKSTLDAVLYFKASPDRRAAYEALTAQDVELTFNNGTNTAKIDFNTKNTITKLNYDTPINMAFTEKLSLVNRMSPSDGADLSVSFT